MLFSKKLPKNWFWSSFWHFIMLNIEIKKFVCAYNSSANWYSVSGTKGREKNNFWISNPQLGAFEIWKNDLILSFSRQAELPGNIGCAWEPWDSLTVITCQNICWMCKNFAICRNPVVVVCCAAFRVLPSVASKLNSHPVLNCFFLSILNCHLTVTPLRKV